MYEIHKSSSSSHPEVTKAPAAIVDGSPRPIDRAKSAEVAAQLEALAASISTEKAPSFSISATLGFGKGGGEGGHLAYQLHQQFFLIRLRKLHWVNLLI